ALRTCVHPADRTQESFRTRLRPKSGLVLPAGWSLQGLRVARSCFGGYRIAFTSSFAESRRLRLPQLRAQSTKVLPIRSSYLPGVPRRSPREVQSASASEAFARSQQGPVLAQSLW